MGRWISSKEFLVLKNFTLQKNKNALYQKVKRANDKQRMFITLDKQYFTFTYNNGIGRGGKVLQIWSEPFKSEAEAQEFIITYRTNSIEKVVKRSRLDSLGSMDLAFSQHDKTIESLVTPQYDKVTKHNRIESSNIKEYTKAK